MFSIGWKFGSNAIKLTVLEYISHIGLIGVNMFSLTGKTHHRDQITKQGVSVGFFPHRLSNLHMSNKIIIYIHWIISTQVLY